MDVSRKVSPDGGWGWVVTGATAIIYFVNFGLSTSHGLLIVGLLRELFPSDRKRLTLIPQLCNGLTRLLAPFMVFICIKTSYRAVFFLGGIVMTLALAICFLASSVNFLIAFLGVLLGVGASGCVFPAAILTTLYFDKHVSLANGIYTAGASIGAVTVPLLVEFLLQSVGVRDTFLYLACISLQVCVAAALCQPVEWHMKDVDTESIDTGKSGSIEVTPKDRPATHTIFDLKPGEGEIREKLKGNKVILTRFEYKQSSIRVRNNISNNNSIVLASDGLQKPPRKISLEPYNAYNRQLSAKSDHHHESFDRRDSFRSSLSSRISTSFVQGLRKASLSMSHPTELIARCPLQTQPSIPEEKNHQSNLMPENDEEISLFSFLKKPEFYFLTLASTGLYINLTTFAVITPDFALEEVDGVNLEMAAYLISALSLADFLTRVSLSWVWDLKCVNKLCWFLIGSFVGGACYIAVSYVQSYYYLLIVAIIDGVSTGVSGVLVSVIFMQSIGPKSFGLAVSTASLVGGFLMIANGFLISIIKEQTGSYKLTYVIMGGYQLAGVIICFIYKFVPFVVNIIKKMY